MGSIPAIPDTRIVPSLSSMLCHERFNEASLLNINPLYIITDLLILKTKMYLDNALKNLKNRVNIINNLPEGRKSSIQ